MVKVEGMPLEALETGVSWDWNSYGEYLSRLEGKVGLNVATMVGHCALRLAVMGSDATKEVATAEDVAETLVWFLEGAKLITGEILIVDSGAHLGTLPDYSTSDD